MTPSYTSVLGLHDGKKLMVSSEPSVSEPPLLSASVCDFSSPSTGFCEVRAALTPPPLPDEELETRDV